MKHNGGRGSQKERRGRGNKTILLKRLRDDSRSPTISSSSELFARIPIRLKNAITWEEKKTGKHLKEKRGKDRGGGKKGEEIG